MFRPLLLAACCLCLSACSTAPSTGKAPSAGEAYAVRLALYDQFGDWRGVPYRMGGMSRSGVDCSALVQITFRDRFGLELPRSTGELVKVGPTVAPGERQSGDLVFFRINSRLNHVGIYLENGTFMHVSSRRGVMISSLSDPYWQQRYWKTVRPKDSLLASR